MKNNQERQGTFFQKIEIDGKTVTAEEAQKKGINLTPGYGKPLIRGVINESVTVKQVYSGRKFTGTADDFFRSFNQTDEQSEQDSAFTPKK